MKQRITLILACLITAVMGAWAETVTAEWDWKNSSPATLSSVNIENTTGNVASTVDGINMYVDATSGKLKANGDNVAFNAGTKLQVPVVSTNDVVTVVAHPYNFVNISIGGTVYTSQETNYTATSYDVNQGYVEIISTSSPYLYSIKVVQDKTAAETVFRDIVLNLTDNTLMTSEVTVKTSFGVNIASDGTPNVVEANAENANINFTASEYNGYQHGWTNLTATVKVDGPVKVTLGGCQYGSHDASITDAQDNKTTFTVAAACWNKSQATENVGVAYYKGEATTLTIKCANYTPYIAIEAVNPVDLINEATVSFVLGDATGMVPASVKAEVGSTITLPKNYTMFVEGKTLTGWSNGETTYAPGTGYTVPDADITLTPVFTTNEVSLANRTEAITLNFDFQRNNGAPIVQWQNTNGHPWVTQATIGGKTIDVAMTIDTNPGKFNNSSNTDCTQTNSGTVFTIPSCEGAIVETESHGSFSISTTTIDGKTDYTGSGTSKVSCTIDNTSEAIQIVIGDGSYYKYVKVTLPVISNGSGEATNKKVHTIGDSTMAFYDENTTITRGWGMYFGNFLTNGWTSVNYARGGRDSRGGYNELWQNAKNYVEAGDYVLIQFAHNDEMFNGVDHDELYNYYVLKGETATASAMDSRGTNPSTTYKSFLKNIIDEVKAKNATPILVGPACRFWFTNGKIRRSGRHDLGDSYDAIVNGELQTGLRLSSDDHTMDYAYQMKQLADAEGVKYVDLTSATEQLFNDYGSERCEAELQSEKTENGVTKPDGTHFRTAGAVLVARLCAQLMKDQGILADNLVIPTDLSVSPEIGDMGDIYVGQSGIKEFSLNGFGLNPTNGTVTVTANNGVKLSTDKSSWQDEIEIEYAGGVVVKSFYAHASMTSEGTFTATITINSGNNSIEVPLTANAIELGGGNPFSVTWALDTDGTADVEGNVTAADVSINAGGSRYKNNTLQVYSGSNLGSWPASEDDDPNRYIEFSVTCPEGTILNVNNIGLKVGAVSTNNINCHIYYSTDNFSTRTTIYSPTGMTSGEMNEVSSSPVIQLEEGESVKLRIYPWSTNAFDSGKYIAVSDVVISGKAKDAAGVNIEGSITYALDKGGLNQGNDVVFNPEALSAGFSGKTWTAGSALTVSGTQNYQGASGEANITQTKVANESGSQTADTANRDNTLTLTLTPEDGFTFVPSRISFEAARYGTDGGNIGASVDAGETHVDLVTNAGVNRSGKSLTIARFSNEVTNVTATADNPLKVNFSFLKMNNGKSMGISNVVIEGQLVGSAAQVTKYILTTQVLPSAEAGSVSRNPDLEQYKEGSTVTLKATKNFGYRFVEWQDATGAVVSTDAETTVTMDAEKTMKAVFESVPVYTVSTQVTNNAERDGLGSITLTPNAHNGQYEAGTTIQAMANESKILKFLSWTDENENANATATREITVNGDMTLVANYEVQDFIAVFDASKTAEYASSGPYPFPADVTWDNNRNARVSVVKQSDGSLVTGTNSVPVVRNRTNSGVLTTLSGVFQNGYNTAKIAWQYQFSTVGFTSATFYADMAAKNAATKNWKAAISIDGTTFEDLGEAWTMTASTLTPLSFTLPESVIGKETVYLRIMGTGEELLSDTYTFNEGTSEEGLTYTSNSESQIGNVYVLGEAVVEADEEAPIVTATIPAANTTGVSATGKITISFNERIQEGNTDGLSTLTPEGDDAIGMTPQWSSSSVSFSYNNLDYSKTYTFMMPAGFVTDRSGNAAEEVTFCFTTMQRPIVTKGDYDAVVSTATELKAAIDAANSRDDKSTRYRIFVKKGEYKLPTGATKHYIHQNNDKTETYWEGDLPDPITYITAANISFIGEDINTTVITQDITNDNDMLFTGQFGPVHKYEEISNSAVLQLESTATSTYFQDITIKSGINDALGRNLAVHDKSSKTIYKNTLLYGYQDTWTSNNQNGLFYFEDGAVRGRTDYLCGKGDAYFKNVELRQLKSGYAAVPSTPANIGWVFKGCTFIGDENGVDGTYSLGRPWGKGTPVAVFIDTKMNVEPTRAGWNEMSGGWPNRFAEYNSMSASGNAIDLSDRKTIFAETHENNPVLTAEEAADYSDMTKMFGEWQPTLATEQAPVPTNVTANGMSLTWDGSDYALLWAVCKDGNVIGFTTEPSFTVTEEGSYSIRAANEMGGLSVASESVTVASDGIATAIDDSISKQSSDSTVKWYNLNGQRVNKPVKGLYITNGKKMVVK